MGFELPLLNFQLSQIALQRDVDFVPLIFQASEGALAQFAQITNRGRAAQKRMNVTFSGGVAIDRSEDHLELLCDQAFQFQELRFISLIELLGAGRIEVSAKLFPTLRVVF